MKMRIKNQFKCALVYATRTTGPIVRHVSGDLVSVMIVPVIVNNISFLINVFRYDSFSNLNFGLFLLWYSSYIPTKISYRININKKSSKLPLGWKAFNSFYLPINKYWHWLFKKHPRIRKRNWDKIMKVYIRIIFNSIFLFYNVHVLFT